MKKIWRNEEGVSPVIAVILMVAITVVLAAVLYVMVSGMMTTTGSTPTVSMSWTENPDAPGNYTGNVVSISGATSVKLKDVSCTATHAGSSGEDTLNDLKGTAKITLGTFSLDFNDVNGDDKLGAQDTFTIVGGTSGDTIRLVYSPTGGQMGQSTLT
ncbi:MAG: type IV pilin [Methanomassiliicoccales archaeon]|nr:MAG: type IV pilin [Methanomassiliicoccales archaeon]